MAFLVPKGDDGKLFTHLPKINSLVYPVEDEGEPFQLLRGMPDVLWEVLRNPGWHQTCCAGCSAGIQPYNLTFLASS